MAPRVLLIEDDVDFRKAAAAALERGGYQISEAGSGRLGVAKTRKDRPDLVILDLVLPGMKGLDVCQELKQDPSTAGVPILILTGNDAEGQEVSCLDMGADDFLAKPVRAERLLAHCRALLRRTRAPDAEPQETLSVGALRLDYRRKAVSFGGREFEHLTPKEFELLFELARHSPQPRSREELYRDIWGNDPPSEVSLRTVEVHVRRLRLKLGWKSDTCLVTITGRGYAVTPPPPSIH